MPKTTFLLAALALLGCGNRNFNRPDLLNEPRILAIQAEPPQPTIGASTTLHALVYQPGRGAHRGLPQSRRRRAVPVVVVPFAHQCE